MYIDINVGFVQELNVGDFFSSQKRLGGLCCHSENLLSLKAYLSVRL